MFIPPPSMQPLSSLGDKDLKLTAIFEELQKHVSSIPDIVRKVKAIFLWNITKAGQLAAQWSECVQYTHCVYYTCMYVYNSIQQDVPKMYACNQIMSTCMYTLKYIFSKGGREGGRQTSSRACIIHQEHALCSWVNVAYMPICLLRN